ncbi:MAG: hypothetical protein EBY44_00320, partial [Actinobacteria bacterium]|nr:hypothetical protein [Actinomycetota bacterium]
TLAARLDRGARMANADEARRATGYAIGGTPPFGHPEPIETLIDPALLEHDVVYAAAGTPDRCFPIGSARLQAVTGAAPADFVVGHRDGPSGAG